MSTEAVLTIPMRSFETAGSNSWTSSPAEMRWPLPRARTSAASSTTGPRLVLTSRDPHFIAPKNFSSTRWWVDSIYGTARRAAPG